MVRYVEHTPTVDEFNYLTDSVGWGTRDKKIVKIALDHTLYSVCVYDDDKLIGYGRLVGDMTIFVYVQDIIVIPEYQSKKIGTGIMNNIVNKINDYKKINPLLRTYVGADIGKDDFYRKFGFITREEANLGAGMILFGGKNEE